MYTCIYTFRYTYNVIDAQSTKYCFPGDTLHTHTHTHTPTTTPTPHYTHTALPEYTYLMLNPLDTAFTVIPLDSTKPTPTHTHISTPDAQSTRYCFHSNTRHSLPRCNFDITFNSKKDSLLALIRHASDRQLTQGPPAHTRVHRGVIVTFLPYQTRCAQNFMLHVINYLHTHLLFRTQRIPLDINVGNYQLWDSNHWRAAARCSDAAARHSKFRFSFY